MSYGDILEPNPHSVAIGDDADALTLVVPRLTIVRGSGEWSGLYRHDESGDAKLVCHGDHYHADEKIYELCGVHVVSVESSDWLERTPVQRKVRGRIVEYYDEKPRRTLTEIVGAASRRQELLARAEALEAEAEVLKAQAAELRGG